MFQKVRSCARGDFVPTDCLITVVTGNELRQSVISVLWPPCLQHMWYQMCERMETFWKIHVRIYWWHKQTNEMGYFPALFFNSFISPWITFFGLCSVVSSRNFLWGRNNMYEQKRSVTLSWMRLRLRVPPKSNGLWWHDIMFPRARLIKAVLL